jgi:ankyrin repeat protein
LLSPDRALFEDLLCGRIAVLCSCSKGSILTALLIFENLCVLLAGDHNQCLPLLHAAVTDGLDAIAVKQLIAAGADLEARCKCEGETRTALLWVAGHAERILCLRALIDAGADVLSTSSDGATAFGIAAQRNNLPGVKGFIARGVDMSLRERDTLHTPLYKACEQGNLGIVMVLCKAGADTHARAAGDYCTVTPFGMAVQNGHYLIVDYLLRSSAKFDLVE